VEDNSLSESSRKRAISDSTDAFVQASNPSILSGLSSLFHSPSVSNILPSEGTSLGPRHGPKLQRKRLKDINNDSLSNSTEIEKQQQQTDEQNDEQNGTRKGGKKDEIKPMAIFSSKRIK